MDAYIEIDGKRAKLTEEQLRALGLEPEKKSLFEKLKIGEIYYFINREGLVDRFRDHCDRTDAGLFKVANYCTDKELMEQRALHETLNRLLWRYSMEHGGDKMDWNNGYSKWNIYYNYNENKWNIACTTYHKYMGLVNFKTSEIAESAIKEIIEPFMAEHPEFKW